MHAVISDQPSDMIVDDRRQAIARSLGFLTAEEVALLASVKPSTLEAWRKRSTGPPYVLFGREALYPIADVKSFLQAEKKDTRAIRAANMRSLL